ncbi:MAG: 16S rRNA (guanine(966)-N(2))-methyltransferase RsmD [Alphaproteobacteria bacterium]|nr:16S rRNA (guanine(966)-N(2))-methyltransferase RsmD [Alphaproteobacteria bacterium]
MRIIGGQYRGKKLFSPDSDKVRPTSDRAREALFNILYSQLENPWNEYTLLDVFAGTGAFALEAISRGVKQVGVIDMDTTTINKNIALFPQEKTKIKVIKANIQKLPAASRAYDILFMDAPYNKGLSEIALQQLHDNGWLKKGALCLVEVEKNEQLAIPPCYSLQNERHYGLAKVLFLNYL